LYPYSRTTLNRTILLVDDDPELLGVLGRFFEQRGWQVQRAADAGEAMSRYQEDRPDLVLLDSGLPQHGSLRFVEVLLARAADATVVMLADPADVATALEAMRLGAENFLTHPVELPHLEAAAERAYEKAELRRRVRFQAARTGDHVELAALGSSPLMLEVATQVETLAGTGATVLLTGEPGTGKGYVARLLHEMSPRAAGPFVEVSCAGRSSAFLDAEIFGHEKGAFADATEQERGLCEAAHTGSFFLDEIGDVSGELQPKLIRLLESRTFHRLGGTRQLEVDVRFLAASHLDFARNSRDRGLRDDLVHRLNMLPLRVPPLRERGREEIADLAGRVLLDLRRRIGRGPTALSAGALDVVTRYAWPGNIRELRNVLEHVLLLADGADEVLPGHLPRQLAGGDGAPASGDEADLTLQEVERRHIARVLAHHSGNRSRTARSLGISRATLYEKLARYSLDDVGRPPGRPRRPGRDG
jgi:DNA-binding NtrC family response regulator